MVGAAATETLSVGLAAAVLSGARQPCSALSAPTRACSSNSRSASRATFALSATTCTRSPRARASSGNRLATHPVTHTSGRWGRLTACRMALRVLASASPVTAHVLITTMSALPSPAGSQPSSERERSIQSLSMRLTLQPRLTTHAFTRRVLTADRALATTVRRAGAATACGLACSRLCRRAARPAPS